LDFIISIYTVTEDQFGNQTDRYIM